MNAATAIDTILQQRPVCPHCGYQHDDAWEWNFGPGLDGESKGRECYKCGGTFDCERVVDLSYTTRLVEASQMMDTATAFATILREFAGALRAHFASNPSACVTTDHWVGNTEVGWSEVDEFDSSKLDAEIDRFTEEFIRKGKEG